MRRGGVPAAIADVRPFTCVCALVVVFGLVCCKRLGAGGETAGVGPVAGVAEEVAREFAALLEVLGGGVAGLPAAEARGARVDVGGFGVRVEIGGAGEGRKAEDAGGVLPVRCC